MTVRGLSYPDLVWRQHRPFAIFSAIVAAVLEYLVIQAITSVDVSSLATLVLSQLPEHFRTMINETLISRMTVEGAAAFGFNHPIVMVLVAINAVTIPGRHLGGEIESGTLELVLSYPVRRWRFFVSLWMTAAAVNFLVVLGGLLGSMSAMAICGVWSGEFALRVAQIASNLWILSLLVTTIAALACAWASKGSRPVLWVALAVLTLYVIHFLTPLWKPLEAIVPFNIFTYYQPQKLMFAETSFGANVALLGGLTCLCLALAARRFEERDIPG